jgi:hypothetical protein
MIRPDHCMDCGAAAPGIPDADDTSIFTRASGWRLVLRKDSDGKHVPEWRCGACWVKYRAAGGHVRTPSKPPGARGR